MTEAPQPCDLLIEAGWVVPVVPHGVVLEDHAVAITDGLITAVLPIRDARARYAAKETIARPHGAVVVGDVTRDLAEWAPGLDERLRARAPQRAAAQGTRA